MRSERHLGIKTRRLLLGAFLLYFFGLLGYLGPAHKHENADNRSHSHPECQLCQVTAQAFAAPVPLLVLQPAANPLVVVVAAFQPVLAFRFQPFSSRAPPRA